MKKEATFKIVRGRKVTGFINPLGDDLIDIARRWRFCVFADGSFFVADARVALHQDMCLLSDEDRAHPFYIGVFDLYHDRIVFLLIQGPIMRHKALTFLRRLIPFETFAQGREVSFIEAAS